MRRSDLITGSLGLLLGELKGERTKELSLVIERLFVARVENTVCVTPFIFRGLTGMCGLELESACNF